MSAPLAPGLPLWLGRTQAFVHGDWEMYMRAWPDLILEWDDRDHPCPFRSTAAFRHENGRCAYEPYARPLCALLCPAPPAM